MEINLKGLDPSHSLRNLPLVDIGAKYRTVGGMTWFPVRPAFGIATKTYNQLSEVWLIDDWVATKDPDAWDEERIDRIGPNGNEGLHYG